MKTLTTALIALLFLCFGLNVSAQEKPNSFQEFQKLWSEYRPKLLEEAKENSETAKFVLVAGRLIEKAGKDDEAHVTECLAYIRAFAEKVARLERELAEAKAKLNPASGAQQVPSLFYGHGGINHTGKPESSVGYLDHRPADGLRWDSNWIAIPNPSPHAMAVFFDGNFVRFWKGNQLVDLIPPGVTAWYYIARAPGGRTEEPNHLAVNFYAEAMVTPDWGHLLQGASPCGKWEQNIHLGGGTYTADIYLRKM